MAKTVFHDLPERLLPWYEQNKRVLPWREDKEPYHVWLSEIMLQQTRVGAVKGYYTRFLQALPTVEDLARCGDDTLHKLWEGLGYYSRVRNLKKAAQIIVEKYGGEFPGQYSLIRALPGIGDYTAGAICSICFDQPTPAVDGNVLRVAARLENDPTPIDLPGRKKEVQAALTEIYPARAGDFTQALMELGATLCGPNRKPDCHNCPCADICRAYLCGAQEQLPVKLPKKERRSEEMTVFILSCEGRYALEKRPETGLLAGLWQFPNRPGMLEAPQAAQMLETMGIPLRQIKRQLDRSHVFTHVRWDMRGIYAEVWQCAPGYTWLTAQEIEQTAALPTAFRQFWEVSGDV